ncbi:MAG: hypothetical protein ACKPKO_34910, partial [Candidatus Fonsibacter sp.]
MIRPAYTEWLFYAAKWEVIPTRGQQVPVSVSTDQWVQNSSSVHLVALWLRVRDFRETRQSDPVDLQW